MEIPGGWILHDKCLFRLALFENNGVYWTMAFQDVFPWTSALWRMLSARRARIVFVLVGGITGMFDAGFHIQAELYARRIRTASQVLATIKLGSTTHESLERVLPGLSTTAPPYSESCSHDVCYYFGVSNLWNGPASTLLEKAGRYGFGKQFYRLLFLLGHRFIGFEGRLTIQNGLVSEYRYNLKLDDGTYGVPGLVTVDVMGSGDNELHFLTDVFDESPEYQVLTFRKWPEKSLGVRFFSGANDRWHHAFQLQLSCLQMLRGCNSAREILPEVHDDMEQISRSVRHRLAGNEPCPDRLIGPRIKHFPKVGIFEAEAKKTSDEIVSGEDQAYRTADLKLLGALNAVQDVMPNQLTEPIRFQSGVAEGITNPSAMALRPGRKVILFVSKQLHVASACTVIPATPSSLLAVRQALAATSLKH